MIEVKRTENGQIQINADEAEFKALAQVIAMAYVDDPAAEWLEDERKAAQAVLMFRAWMK